MPCDSYGYAALDRADHAREVSHLTALLCAACRALMAYPKAHVPPDVAAWWVAHEAADQARAEADKRARDVTRERLRRVIRDAEAELAALD